MSKNSDKGAGSPPAPSGDAPTPSTREALEAVKRGRADARQAARQFIVRDRAAKSLTLRARARRGKCGVAVAFAVKGRRVTLSEKACNMFASDLEALTKAGAIVPVTA